MTYRTCEISPGVTELDHTSDVGISVEAASLGELFGRATAGIFALMWDGDLKISEVAQDRLVKLRAGGPDMLLVRWLGELLYIHEVEGIVYRTAALEAIDGHSLTGTLSGGYPVDPPLMEVKGVTYHGLEVNRRDGRWHARLFFDV